MNPKHFILSSPFRKSLLFLLFLLGGDSLLGCASLAPPPRPSSAVQTATLAVVTPAKSVTSTSLVTPTETLNPVTPSSTPLVLDEAARRFVGKWMMTLGNIIEFKDDLTFSETDSGHSKVILSGTWQVGTDGRMRFASSQTGTAQLDDIVGTWYGNLLILRMERTPDSYAFLIKLDERGGLVLDSTNQPSVLSRPLFDINKVTEIEIDDGWGGLSPISPIAAHYLLKKQGDGFVGQADFSVGGSSLTKVMTATVPIKIPQPDAQSFLQSLAATAVDEGKYIAYWSHTDDFPSTQIIARFPPESILIHSESQDLRIPWQVQIKDKAYISFSTLLLLAIEKINPFLARDVQQKLINAAQR